MTLSRREHDPEKCEAVFRKDHAQAIVTAILCNGGARRATATKFEKLF
jgi:hypothetical protein